MKHHGQVLQSPAESVRRIVSRFIRRISPAFVSGLTPASIAGALLLLLAGPGSEAAAQVATEDRTTPDASVTEAAEAVTRAFDLTVASIMRGPELVGSPPGRIRWTDDGEWVYFRWKPGGEAWHEDADLYRVATAGGNPERLSEEEADSLGALLAEGDISPDERWRVVSHRGDIHRIDRRTLEIEQLTETRRAERSPVFAPDGRSILFVADQNVFRLTPAEGRLVQLTDLRTEAEREDEESEGQRGFLEEQQEELFEHIRRGIAEREEREEREERREEEELPTVYLGDGERLSGVSAEPGGRYAVLQLTRPARDSRATIVPDYVTESGYTEPMEVRSKVGDEQSNTRVALLEIESGEVTWPELVPGGGDLETEDDAASDTAADDGGTRSPAGSGAAVAAASFLAWSADGEHGLIGVVSGDFKEQWLHVVDAATGELTTIAHDRDEAWIGGPCDPWLSERCAGWLPDGEGVYFISERDGYSHLYTVGIDGEGLRQLTSGEFEVFSAEVAPDEDHFYLHTSRGSAFERHFEHLGLRGGEPTRITAATGEHRTTPSPDGDRLAVVHSTSNHPPELYLRANRADAEMQRVTSSPTEEWLDGPWIEPEIIRFQAADGAMVPARIYRPGDLDAPANGAAVIFVHGAGYLHNVHRYWSTYYREYMFHHLLASRGFVVLDIDFRGSAGYGRDWRTAIYRHMGGKDLSDQVDGARYLLENEGVDSPERIGIYGGSYGGFITLMALFTEPEHFGAGAALRSVTDWAHYNHWYTGRILNLPQEDEEAYRQSSPIYFAEGLEDPLLIAHGMVDTNVQFQDVVRLAQRLIELGKTDWEMAVYPVESHGFEEPSSWTDEYRRILELFEENLMDLDPEDDA